MCLLQMKLMMWLAGGSARVGSKYQPEAKGGCEECSGWK